MFVSENAALRQGFIKLNISTLDGDSISAEVSLDTNVDVLKIEAVSQLIDSAQSSKLSLYYSLVHIKSGQHVNEEQTLRQLAIGDNDEMLLVRRRMPVTSLKKEGKATQSTSSSEIAAATAHLPCPNTDRQQLEHAVSIDFQTELKKILVSLIDVAQKLMCLNPAGYKEAAKYVTLESVPETRREHCTVDQLALRQLVDMGFSRSQATKALLVNRMCQAQAIQWLCENTDTGEKEAAEATCETAPAALPSAEAASKETTLTDDLLKQELMKLSQLPGAVKVNHMLTAFKAFKRRVFKPDPHALQSLLEMGFTETDAIDALRTHNNLKDEACDWLLNHNNDSPASASGEAVDEGLDPESSVYKAIMSSDVIQLALMNPRTLTALLHILENPSFIQQWLRDADLSPMLLQISRIYHTEKYRS